jgi:hypothetical protein
LPFVVNGSTGTGNGPGGDDDDVPAGGVPAAS